MLSRSTQYAFAALACLSTQAAVKLATAEEIAAKTQIPRPYLSKLLKHLADAELIKSFKGRKGGYQLCRAATELTMGEIMGALGEKTPSQFCVLTPSRCGRGKQCLLHKPWERFWLRIEKTTLAHMTKSGSALRPSLSEIQRQ